MNRWRVWFGSLAAPTIAFLIAAWCHEATHIIQAWTQSGSLVYDMEWNPLLNPATCGGRFACAGLREETTGPIWGEAPAYAVTVLVFVPLYLWLLGVFRKGETL